MAARGGGGGGEINRINGRGEKMGKSAGTGKEGRGNALVKDERQDQTSGGIPFNWEFQMCEERKKS